MSEQSLENMESIFYVTFLYFSVDAFSCYEEFRKLFSQFNQQLVLRNTS